MSLPAIEVSGLSKRYVIERESRHDSLRDTLHHSARKLWRRLRWGTGFEREEFWALRDVSFSIQPGEVVGIIGRNGAGKSTLLKILSRITEPTAGQITLRGRVASLLEVGTGFHPDLSGRENIYLNGAILGMQRAEIRKKFDEIVAFAEVEKFLDTPVKRYSSGMYVRLAFAVAAHLEPEILIVDEVLAVGDAQFQKKCLGKIEDVARNQGRTVLFVSHNMGVIGSLCRQCLWMDSGQIRDQGSANDIIGRYINAGGLNNAEVIFELTNKHAGSAYGRLLAARVVSGEKICREISIEAPVFIEIDYSVNSPKDEIIVGLHLHDKQGVCIFSSGPQSGWVGTHRRRDRIHIPGRFLNDGRHTVTLLLLRAYSHHEAHIPEALTFEIMETGVGRGAFTGSVIGCIRPQLNWTGESLLQSSP